MTGPSSSSPSTPPTTSWSRRAGMERPGSGTPRPASNWSGPRAALLRPRDGSFITYGATGLRRWPLPLAPAGAPAILQAGPPRILDTSSRSDSYHACLGHHGRLLAVGDRPRRQAVVMEVDRP